ncbi:MAG: hypothetical protein O2960_28550 [Verrucomicrobia bacterium]|nr:hypothetical protein [Verrucomicrobiota bacterium]
MTKKKPKIGRPPIPKKARLRKVFAARLRVDEEREVLRAIEASGMTQANWIREALIKAARGG